MRSFKTSALSFFILGALFLSAPVFALDYSITGLGTLGGSTSYAYSINNNGQIVGESDIAGNAATRAFVYTNGAMTNLGTLSGTSGSFAVGINNNGQIVGNSYSNAYTYNPNRAFLYTNGSMQDIGTLGGSSSYILGNGINNSGQVVGISSTAGNAANHAFLYSNGSMSDLTASTGLGMAVDINDNGQIAGTNASSHAGLYSNGTVADLGTLGGLTSFSTDLNNNGQVIGSSYVAGNTNTHAFLYSNGSMIDLGAQPGMDSFALGINASGMVVGDFQVVPGQFGPPDSFRAFLYSNGVMTDLNTLLAANSGWTLYSASAINDWGQIVGAGSFNGQMQAFLLNPNPSPVPLPAAVWLFGSGLLGLFGAARIRKRV